jgi:hypothetical protein
MRPEDMIRELPGPPVEAWIARMPTHKVGLSSPEQVDAEVEAWLRAAYDARG